MEVNLTRPEVGYSLWRVAPGGSGRLTKIKYFERTAPTAARESSFAHGRHKHELLIRVALSGCQITTFNLWHRSPPIVAPAFRTSTLSLLRHLLRSDVVRCSCSSHVCFFVLVENLTITCVLSRQMISGEQGRPWRIILSNDGFVVIVDSRLSL